MTWMCVGDSGIAVKSIYKLHLEIHSDVYLN